MQNRGVSFSNQLLEDEDNTLKKDMAEIFQKKRLPSIKTGFKAKLFQKNLPNFSRETSINQSQYNNFQILYSFL